MIPCQTFVINLFDGLSYVTTFLVVFIRALQNCQSANCGGRQPRSRARFAHSMDHLSLYELCYPNPFNKLLVFWTHFCVLFCVCVCQWWVCISDFLPHWIPSSFWRCSISVSDNLLEELEDASVAACSFIRIHNQTILRICWLQGFWQTLTE